RTDTVPHDTPNEELDPLYPQMKISSYSDISNAERYQNAVRELELRWTHGARVKGFEIDLIGKPQYTVVK
ncbi:hypothetical protein ACVZHT_40040, partial [Vibrio diabolicus]